MKTKNLNLNNIPEDLIRRVRSAAASEGKTLYEWAIEAFKEKLSYEIARDPHSVTERLVNAVVGLAGPEDFFTRLENACMTIAPLQTDEFPVALQKDIEAIQNADLRDLSQEEQGEMAEKITLLLVKIWGPEWYR